MTFKVMYSKAQKTGKCQNPDADESGFGTDLIAEIQTRFPDRLA